MTDTSPRQNSQTEAYADHFDLLEQQVALRDKYIMGHSQGRL